MKRLLLIAFFVLAATAVAQSYVQPMPCLSPWQTQMQFPQQLLLSDGGLIDAGAARFVPDNGATGASAPYSKRRSITVCNGSQNLGTPVFKCRWDVDGGWPTSATGATASPGLTLQVGDCVTLAEPSGNPVRCVTASVDAGLEVTECR